MDRNEQNPFVGMTDVGQAEHTFNKFRVENPNEQEAMLSLLSDLLDALLGSEEKLTGDSDDFHNFAVTISKVANDNKNAYAIICEGLKIHTVNPDLLADALMYGYNAGAKDECEQWYHILMSVDKSFWTWRAFSFTITYLLDVYGSSENNIASIEEILTLAREYQEYLPNCEDAWISLYRVYDRINQQSKGVAVLEEAIDKFIFCPKCWLRYADIMIDCGNYEKAEPVIKKMLRNPKATEYVNTSYVYFLDGQCKFAKLMNSESYEMGEVDERAVQMIYRSFRLARKSQGLRENTNQRIEEYIDRLTVETGIAYEYEE